MSSPLSPTRAFDNEYGYGYVGRPIRSNSPAKALYCFYLGEGTQDDYCTLAKFVEDHPTSTAASPMAIGDDRLRERAGVSSHSSAGYAIEALNGGLQPTFKMASLLALAAMSLKLFPKGQESADKANEWLGLVDPEDIWVYHSTVQDGKEVEGVIAGDFEEALPELLKTYCEMAQGGAK